MARKWFQPLAILAMAFFAGQGQPLTAQSEHSDDVSNSVVLYFLRNDLLNQCFLDAAVGRTAKVTGPFAQMLRFRPIRQSH